MPFYKSIEINHTTRAYLWHITESYDELFQSVKLKEASIDRLAKMKSVEHQKGFLAVRMLLQHVGFSDFDLFYDEFGKPHLVESFKVESLKSKVQSNIVENDSKIFDYHISISHSHEFSSICISKHQNIGIDLEKLKEKILRIAPKFMDISYLENLSVINQIRKATIIWGIKESIFKIKNEKGISFPNHISEKPFEISDSKTLGYLDFNGEKETFHIQFYNIEDYIFVCAFPVI